MRIFGIAHHHKFICIEYQHFRDICNILVVIKCKQQYEMKFDNNIC